MATGELPVRPAGWRSAGAAGTGYAGFGRKVKDIWPYDGRHTRVSGPHVRRPGRRALSEDFCDDWEADYAQEVDRAVHDRLRQVLKHPTGNYERHIQTRKEGGHHDVDDSNIIYGPWLEGTGSRNAPNTRFKGYATFRKVAQADGP